MKTFIFVILCLPLCLFSSSFLLRLLEDCHEKRAEEGKNRPQAHKPLTKMLCNFSSMDTCTRRVACIERREGGVSERKNP